MVSTNKDSYGDTAEDGQGYNGWTNYETWCVNLWLTNEEGSNDDLLEIVGLTWPDADDATTIYNRTTILKEWVMDMAPIDGATMFVDLLQASLDNVNWREIIENHEVH